MQVIPIASESLGTRGLSLFIISEDQEILIDPSVSLAPFRNGHPPHIQEVAASYLSRQYIMKFWKLATIIIQTHYHADHYSLGMDRPYEFTNRVIADILYSHPKKKILAKDPTRNINFNQKKRAFGLWRRNGIPLFVADGNTFVFGNTRIVFSMALPHGKLYSKQGWVVAVFISDSYESVLISSDVVGPGSDIALNFINENPADLIIIDGPSTYHPKQTTKDTERAFERLMAVNDMDHLIIDHHFLRDLEWKTLLKDHSISREKTTLASLLDIPPFCLESKRSLLYNQTPLDSFFHSRFQSHNEEILKKIIKVTKALPHNLKMDRLYKEVLERSKTYNFR
ncbi:MAG: hypothetical protein ACFFDT_39040 [Candidatus Hodarchaeota archaeon]